MIDWQPIETAPKEGTVLLWLESPMYHNKSRVEIGMLHPKIRYTGGIFAFDAPKATHWAPLPEGPSQERRSENER